MRLAGWATDLQPNHALRAGSVLSLLGALALVAAPHAQRLPPWVSVTVAALLSWRSLAAWRHWRLPGRWVLLVLAAAMTFGVVATYVPLLGRDASVALLAMMVGLKCLELRTLRDAAVALCLGYFLIITGFLYSQTIATAFFMLAVMAWLTATMVSFQDRGRRVSPAGALRTSAVLMVQAAPLMFVLFLFFPRIQGPVFGFPQATSARVSGLSDNMSPGDLANLGLSDEVAFRVEFHTPLPKPAQLYWRGPVLWDFDGRTWSMGATRASAVDGHEARSEPIRYTVTLEPHHMRWLFAIDLPDSVPLGASLTSDYQLLSQRPVRVRQRYAMTSHPGYRFGLQESPEALRRALRLPPRFNPQAVALARSIRARSADEVEIVKNVLNIFRTQLFFYTLVPPELGRHSVDEFLFQTRRGFCEHYSSAFVFLMRAAGIPARVVTGYQGGELNPLGEYLIVRQSEAHAWAEVWIDHEGWLRVDPTSAVSPARIEVGVAAAVPQTDPLPLSVRGDFRFLKRVRFALDAIANSWNQWVLGYTPDRQLRLMQRVGLGRPSWQTLTVVLMCVASAVLLVLALAILRRLRGAALDPAQRAYQRFCRKLARSGLTRAPAEGPHAFARRVIGQRPGDAAQVLEITDLYVGLRYGTAGDRELRALRSLVSGFRS
jgi:transglutaminase-like putative cysteine protease